MFTQVRKHPETLERSNVSGCFKGKCLNQTDRTYVLDKFEKTSISGLGQSKIPNPKSKIVITAPAKYEQCRPIRR